MQSLQNAVLDEEIIDEDEAKREEWFAQRSGKITCSHFGDLMKPGRAKDADFTATGYAYLQMKIAERLGSWHSASSAAMSWGTENESDALKAYTERTGYIAEQNQYGFLEYTDDVGGTPDSLVDTCGCVEVKCPYNPVVHVETMLNRTVPEQYRWQVIGHMLVTGREWCDFVSFDPRMTTDERLVVITVKRDETEIEHLKKRLALAVSWIDEQMARLS